MLNRLISFLQTIQLYHWRTYSHSRHVASSELYEQMTGLVDRFMEVYMGRYKRIAYKNQIPDVHDHTHKSIIPYLRSFVRFLDTLPFHESDLLNIRDEMTGLINRTLYLFTHT